MENDINSSVNELKNTHLTAHSSSISSTASMTSGDDIDGDASFDFDSTGDFDSDAYIESGSDKEQPQGNTGNNSHNNNNNNSATVYQIHSPRHKGSNENNRVSHKYVQTLKKSNRLSNVSRRKLKRDRAKLKAKTKDRERRMLQKLNTGPMSIMKLVWGRFTSESISLRPNIVIAADIFYNENDFEDILANVQYYFNHSCDAFYAVVQKRGTSRTLGTLLLKWKMKVEEIDILHTIMGSDYLNIEESEKMILVKITSAKHNKKSTHHRTQSVMGLLRMQTNIYTNSNIYNNDNNNNDNNNNDSNNNSNNNSTEKNTNNTNNNNEATQIAFDGVFFFHCVFLFVFLSFFLFFCIS